MGKFTRDADGRERDIWLEVDEMIGLLTEIRDATRTQPEQADAPESYTKRLSVNTADTTIPFVPPLGQFWAIEAISILGVAAGVVEFYEGDQQGGALVAMATLDAAGRGIISPGIPIPIGGARQLTAVTTGMGGQKITINLWPRISNLNDPAAKASLDTGEI